ncbi:MAG: ferritin [Methanomicrobiales archaeon]
MIHEKLHQMLNAQINWELYSAYLYLSMAAYADSIGLKGFANWFRIQEQEERFHALKFFDYLESRGLKVTLLAIDQPPAEWESPVALFEETAAHEEKVTGLINDLMAEAIEERDYATISFLQWYVDEQVEEEENARDILEKIRVASAEAGSPALYMLDRELAQRVYTPPAGGAGD